MKTIKLRGGFHNCPPISLKVSEQAYQEAVDSGYFSPESSGSVVGWADAYLTEYQLKKIDKHFCGIKGCLCGGIARGVYFELD